MITMMGNNPMLTSKVHVLLNASASFVDKFSWDFYTGILLMKQSKWGITP